MPWSRSEAEGTALLSARTVSRRATWTPLGAAVDEVKTFAMSDLPLFRLWTRSEALLARALGGEALEENREGNPNALSVSGLTVSRVRALTSPGYSGAHRFHGARPPTPRIWRTTMTPRSTICARSASCPTTTATRTDALSLFAAARSPMSRSMAANGDVSRQ